MRKTEKEYRKFEANLFAISPLAMALADIPTPDPEIKNLKKKQLDARKVLFKESDLLERLIAHMAKPE